MRRIGIYGGTFSPPHNGHVAAAKAFMEQMWLDILYVIPAYTPPHKTVDNPISAADRMKMCELAFSGIEGVIVSDLEIVRGGKSYTVETLRALTEQFASDGEETRLFLLCGTDMMLTLDEWYCADEIFRLCYPVYIRREGADTLIDATILQKLAAYQTRYGKIVRKIQSEPLPISSTDIRDALREGQKIDGVVPPAVADYIKRQNLYV